MVATTRLSGNAGYKEVFKAAGQLECHKFCITHVKEVDDWFYIVGKRPDWEKPTTAKLWQHLECYSE